MNITNPQGLQLYDPAHLLVEPTGRIFRSRLPNVATAIQLVSNTAYFVYVGRTSQPVALQYVEFYVSTAGQGMNTVEVGLFSTPADPNNVGQTLTKLAVVGTSNIDSLLSTGLKWNSNLDFGYTVPTGTYLWAGIRTAGYTTQPSLAGLCMDFQDGLVLLTSTAGALTGAGPWTGALPAIPASLNTAIAPDLRVRWNPS